MVFGEEESVLFREVSLYRGSAVYLKFVNHMEMHVHSTLAKKNKREERKVTVCVFLQRSSCLVMLNPMPS